MKISDGEARITYRALARLLKNHKATSREVATLIEARRLIEIELFTTGRGELADALHHEPNPQPTRPSPMKKGG